MFYQMRTLQNKCDQSRLRKGLAVEKVTLLGQTVEQLLFADPLLVPNLNLFQARLGRLQDHILRAPNRY